MVLITIASLFATGCGTGEYRRMIDASVGHARTSAPYRTLFAYTSLPGTPLKVRVPITFNHSYREDSAHPEDGAKIKPDRFQPPFLELEGLKYCYEAHTADPQSGAKVPFYCYLAALPARPGDAERLAGELQAKLKAKFDSTPDHWEPIDAYSENGKASPWKKIRVESDQPFYTSVGETREVKVLPAIFELWMRDLEDTVVLVGWRTPKSIEGLAPPAKGGDMTPPTKPDLSASPTSMPALTAGTLKSDGPPPEAEPAAAAG